MMPEFRIPYFFLGGRLMCYHYILLNGCTRLPPQYYLTVLLFQVTLTLITGGLSLLYLHTDGIETT